MVEKHSCRNAPNPTLSEGPHVFTLPQEECVPWWKPSHCLAPLELPPPPHSVSVSLSSERVTDPQGQDMAGWIQSGRDAVAVLPSSVSVFVQSEGIDRHSGYL